MPEGVGVASAVVTPPSARSEASRRRRPWWTLFGLLAVASSVWALALPLMSGPDEADQATRAAAVARGHLFGVRWRVNTTVDNYTIKVMAPLSYVSAHDVGFCHTLNGEAHRSVFDEATLPDPEPGTCPEMTGSNREEAVSTNEFRGQPLYYFLVGLPTLVAEAATGAYLMRVVGAVLCSAFLASALLSLTRLRRPLLAVLGGAVVVTPAVLYFAGTVNPVGLEIATSFGVWTGLLALVRGRGGDTGRLVVRTGLALVVLVSTRGLSPGFALLTMLVVALVAPPGRIRDLLRRRDVRGWLVAAGVATAVSIAWLVHIRARFHIPPMDGSGLDFALEQVPWWGREMVGVFGPTTVVPPVAVPLLWAAALVTVVALGWRAADRRHLLLAAGLAVATVGLLIAGEGFNLPPTDVWWQGRYVLPIAIGAVVLTTLASRQVAGVANGSAASAASAGAVPPAGDSATGSALPGGTSAGGGLLRRIGPPLLALLVGLQVWCLAYAVRHFTVGHDGTANPLSFLFDPAWAPPLLPAWLYVVLYAAALGGTATLLWRVAVATAMATTASHDDGASDDQPVDRRGAVAHPLPQRPSMPAVTL